MPGDRGIQFPIQSAGLSSYNGDMSSTARRNQCTGEGWEEGNSKPELYDWTGVGFSQLHAGDHAMDMCCPQISQTLGTMYLVLQLGMYQWHRTPLQYEDTYLQPLPRPDVLI
jgi:hypothetical protein